MYIHFEKSSRSTYMLLDSRICSSVCSPAGDRTCRVSSDLLLTSREAERKEMSIIIPRSSKKKRVAYHKLRIEESTASTVSYVLCERLQGYGARIWLVWYRINVISRLLISHSLGLRCWNNYGIDVGGAVRWQWFKKFQIVRYPRSLLQLFTTVSGSKHHQCLLQSIFLYSSARVAKVGVFMNGNWNNVFVWKWFLTGTRCIILVDRLIELEVLLTRPNTF